MSLLIVAGCGGGATDTTSPTQSTQFAATLPELSNVFAQFANGAEEYDANPRWLQSTGTSGDTAGIPVTIRSADDGSGDIIVNDGEFDYRLARDDSSGQYLLPTAVDALFGDTAGSSIFGEAVLGDDVGVILIAEQAVDQDSAGFLLFGRESTDVGVQSGKALYLGPSAFLSVADNGAVNGGGGGFVMEADFGAATVDGVIALTDAVTSTEFQLGFEEAAIAGNGFSTTALQQSGLSGVIISSDLSATFYGDDAAEVGGSFDIDLVTGGTVTFLSGAMIGARQSGDLEDVAASGGSFDIGGGETVTLGSDALTGGSGSVYPDGSSSYFNSNTGASFGADASGCYYVGDWSNC